MPTPFALMLNPKNGAFVACAGHGEYYSIYLVGSGVPEEPIGESYTEDQMGDFRRIHAPRGVKEKGQGYGLMLYAGTSLGAAMESGIEGVYSIPGQPNRSRDADRMWDSLIRNDLADREGGDSYESTTDHCEQVRNGEIEDFDGEGHRARVLADEVCQEVAVEVEGSATDTLQAARVLKEGFVVHYDDGVEDDQRPPGDLLARVRVPNVETLNVLVPIFKEHYDEADYAAFMSRSDVVELLGQQRLPGVAGLSAYQHFGADVPKRRVPLPPLSQRSQKLLTRWKDAL